MKSIDKRRMEELREEVGVRESLTRKLVRNRLKWAGRVERIEGSGSRREWLRLERVEGEGREEYGDGRTA